MTLDILLRDKTVYVLALEEAKWYIGKTGKDVITRFNEHLKGQCPWTEKYRPLRIAYTFENQDAYDEDTWVKRCMQQYGIENVRGGSYANLVLSDAQVAAIKNELRSAADLCYNCEKPGHFQKSCPLTVLTCTRCGRTGHTVKDCRASTRSDQTPYDRAHFTSEDGSDESLSDVPMDDVVPKDDVDIPDSDIPDAFMDDSDSEPDSSSDDFCPVDAEAYVRGLRVKRLCVRYETRAAMSLRLRSGAVITG